MHNKKHLINNLEFAQSGQSAIGTLNLADCVRLRDSLDINSQDFKLNYTLVGQVNLGSEARLNLKINTLLPCVCQRCLETVNIVLDLNIHYLVSSKSSEELDSVDDVDWLETDMEMDLDTLIEDEVLVAFPFAPMHQSCLAMTMVSGEKPNPFAALKMLKK